MDPRGWWNMQAELFRLMVEASTDGLWILDEHGTHPLRQRADGRAARAGARATWTASRPSTPSTRRASRTCAGTSPTWSAGTRARTTWRRGCVRPDGSRAVDPGQLVRAARRRRRAAGLAAPGRGVHRAPGARGDAARARAAARRRAEHREDRQLGVGRRRPTRSPGPTSSTASTTWSRRRSRRRTTASWTSCTRTTGPWCGRRSPPRSRAPTSSTSTPGSSGAGGEQRWVRGLGVVRRGPDGAPGAGWAAPPRTSPTWRRADALAAAATRRLELLQQMAMAANQATTLDEAHRHGGRRRCPRTRTWSPVGVYAVADGRHRSTPLAAAPAARLRRPPSPTPSWPGACCASGVAGARPASGSHADTHSLVAIPVLLAGRVVCGHRGARRRGAAGRDLPGPRRPDRRPARPGRGARAQRRTSWPRPGTRRWRPRGSSRSSSPR